MEKLSMNIEMITDVSNCLFTMTHCNPPINNNEGGEKEEKVDLVGKSAEIIVHGIGRNNYAIFNRARIVRETSTHVVVIYMANETLMPGRGRSTTESIKKSDIVKLQLFAD